MECTITSDISCCVPFSLTVWDDRTGFDIISDWSWTQRSVSFYSVGWINWNFWQFLSQILKTFFVFQLKMKFVCTVCLSIPGYCRNTVESLKPIKGAYCLHEGRYHNSPQIQISVCSGLYIRKSKYSYSVSFLTFLIMNGFINWSKIILRNVCITTIRSQSLWKFAFPKCIFKI